MTYTERARKMRPYIVQAANALDDKTVSLAPELLGTLTGDGSLVKSGTRINWHGKIKKAAVDLWDTAQNTPDEAPDLWSDLAFLDGYRIIPEVFTAELAFSMLKSSGIRLSVSV